MINSDIVHRYDAFTLEVALRALPGQVLCLFGPSGSGKSTLLRVLVGLAEGAEGSIVMGNRVLVDSRNRIRVPPQDRRMGYMPQDYALFPHMTVLENVLFGLSKWNKRTAVDTAMELLAKFEIQELTHRYPGTISSGQQQRTALARAMAPRPDALLLDEPFSALDPALRMGLRLELRALTESLAVPIILVTHDWDDVLSLADQVMVLDQGRVVTHGEPMDVLRQPTVEILARSNKLDNLFKAEVVKQDRHSGTLGCSVGGGVILEVPFTELPIGSQVRLGLRSADILVTRDEPRSLSAQNVLRGRIRNISQRGFVREVEVDCGAFFKVEVTPGALGTLNLEIGSQAWLVFKANSLVLIE